jgi:hypothetical protein
MSSEVVGNNIEHGRNGDALLPRHRGAGELEFDLGVRSRVSVLLYACSERNPGGSRVCVDVGIPMGACFERIPSGSRVLVRPFTDRARDCRGRRRP